MRYIVAKVKCCGKAHEIRLSEAGSIVADSHRGVQATAAASAAAMGAPVRCVEVLNDWAKVQAERTSAVGKAVGVDLGHSYRHLPEILQRAFHRGFAAAFAWQEKRSPEARRAKRIEHAASKVKELDRRIKRLQTARKTWAGKLRRYAREVEK